MPGDNEGGAPRGPRFDPIGSYEDDRQAPESPTLNVQCLECHRFYKGPHKDENPGRQIATVMPSGEMLSIADANGRTPEELAGGSEVSHGVCSDRKECQEKYRVRMGLDAIRQRHPDINSAEEWERLRAEMIRRRHLMDERGISGSVLDFDPDRDMGEG